MSSERLPLVLWLTVILILSDLQCKTGCNIHIVLQTTENMYISKKLEDLIRGSDMLRQMNKIVS